MYNNGHDQLGRLCMELALDAAGGEFDGDIAEELAVTPDIPLLQYHLATTTFRKLAVDKAPERGIFDADMDNIGILENCVR